MNISVIICTHNPREDYLRRVLDALKAQTLPKEQWELLLVDNASRVPLAGKWDLSWHPQGRHLREEKIGKTNALLLAIGEFKGELFVIVDDDNVLRQDYLEAALKIARDYPWLGAWSGRSLPEFEVKPSAELEPWTSGLVIDRLTKPIWAKLPRYNEASPAGAGMVVRREQVLHYHKLASSDPLRLALGRRGKSLAGGEDGDMALCGFELGLGTGKFPDLELIHLIPARRVTLEYLEGINEGFGYALVILDHIYNSSSQMAGQIKVNTLRIWLLRIAMLLMGKKRAERRIRIANEKGRLHAFRELKAVKSNI